MSDRLWEKGEELNQLIHNFTVGNDPEIDRALVRWDAQGSAAHARMLHAIGLLSKDECSSLLALLSEIVARDARGEFTIPAKLEDCHTAIEAFLTDRADDAGRKIHTGRSRNDQVLLAMRLYLRASLLAFLEQTSDFASALITRANETADFPLAGYTHFQPAMPASVGMWFHAFAESSIAITKDGLALLGQLDCNPLGTASGFGVPLPLDRRMTADVLKMSQVQRNPIAVQNSRGYFELRVARLLSDAAALIEKLACDLILYTMREFGFFSIPASFTTGSSIMPQKHNPDVIELLRARAAKVRAAEQELSLVTMKLPSHYHRDFQYTKEPVMRSVAHLHEMLPIVSEVVRTLVCNREALERGMTDDLYATYDVYKAVREGAPFRDAYRATAERIRQGTLDVSLMKSEFSHVAAVNAAEREEAARELASLGEAIAAWRKKLDLVDSTIFALPS